MTIHIDNLPNECILEIFSYLIDLTSMIKCSYVSKRWRSLALYRLSRIKGLYSNSVDYRPSHDTLASLSEEKKYNIVRLLPNLTFIDSIFDTRGSTARFTHAIVHLKKLRAVRMYYPHLLSRATILPNRIDSVATQYSRRYFKLLALQIGPQLKQLYIMIFPFKILAEYAMFLPSLIRLHMQLKPIEPDYYYSGPMLSNLQVLEIVAKNQYGVISLNVALDMLNYCPKLKSAFFCLRTERFHVKLKPSRIEKHHNLEDLVLIYYTNKQGKNPEYWSLLVSALTKFPNLKHLAIRDHSRITEDAIVKILERLPNLRLLDVRGALLDSETLIEAANFRRAKPVDICFECFNTPFFKDPKMIVKLDFMKYSFFVRLFNRIPKLYDIGQDES